VLGVGPGWATPDPSPEAFLQNFDACMTIDPLVLPKSGEQEVMYYGPAIGAPGPEWLQH